MDLSILSSISTNGVVMFTLKGLWSSIVLHCGSFYYCFLRYRWSLWRFLHLVQSQSSWSSIALHCIFFSYFHSLWFLAFQNGSWSFRNLISVIYNKIAGRLTLLSSFNDKDIFSTFLRFDSFIKESCIFNNVTLPVDTVNTLSLTDRKYIYSIPLICLWNNCLSDRSRFAVSLLLLCRRSCRCLN